MTCAAVKRRLVGHLTCVEAQVREARRILEADLPNDVLLATIGAIQVLLEEMAAAVPATSGEKCWLRLNAEEFSVEFEQTFGLQLRVCRDAGCQPANDASCRRRLTGSVGTPRIVTPSPSKSSV